MSTTDMSIARPVTGPTHRTSLGTAALIAGIGLLIMAIAAPFAEMYAYPQLVVPGNAAETVENILANLPLFASAILGYLIAFLCDVVVAWALYILLKPVDENLSLLTAWFRLVYTVIALTALLNLVTVLRVLDASSLSTLSPSQALQGQVMDLLNAFKSHWNFGLMIFGIHLVLLGYLVVRSTYIPKLLGALLILAGAGYLISTLKPFLFPGVNLAFTEYTFYGEVVFMLWLLIRGPKIKVFNEEAMK